MQWILFIILLLVSACGSVENEHTLDNVTDPASPSTSSGSWDDKESGIPLEKLVVTDQQKNKKTEIKIPNGRSIATALDDNIVKIRPELVKFVPKTGYLYNYFANRIPAPAPRMLLKSGGSATADCSSFPDGYKTHEDDENFGVCISSPEAEAEYIQHPSLVHIEGNVKSDHINDLQLRVQSLIYENEIKVIDFNQINYNANTGHFSADVSLDETGTYAISVIATKFADDVIAHPEPITLQYTIYVHRVTKPTFTIIAPIADTPFKNNEAVPVILKANFPETIGIPEVSVSVNDKNIPALFTSPDDQGIMEGKIELNHGKSIINITLHNKSGKAEQTISVYNDLKGPEIKITEACHDHHRTWNGKEELDVPFKFNISDDNNDTKIIHTLINGTEQKDNCVANDKQYNCQLRLSKSGVNLLQLKVEDSLGNISEFTKGCALIKSLKPILEKNDSNKFVMKSEFYTPHALMLALQQKLITNDLSHTIEKYLNSVEFRESIPNLLRNEVPKIGIYPYSKGNTSIDIDPNTLEIGKIFFNSHFDTEKNNLYLDLEINKLKGKMAMVTFYVKMMGGYDTGLNGPTPWPDLDNCGHPIPLNQYGAQMPLPADPSQRGENNICELNWNPNFAGNYCDYNIVAADPANVNKQCFINKIDKHRMPLLLNIDKMSLTLRIHFVMNDGFPKIQIEMSRPQIADDLKAEPADAFIKADPDSQGSDVYDNPFTQLLDIREEFKRTIIDMLAKEVPFQINHFLKKPIKINQSLKLLGVDRNIQVNVSLGHSELAMFNKNSADYLGLSIALSSSGDPSYLTKYLTDAEQRAKALSNHVDFIDSNDNKFNPLQFGPLQLFHSNTLTIANLVKDHNQTLASALSEDGINQILFGVVSSGLLDIPFGPKIIEENKLELPSILQPNVASLLGAGFKRKDGKLLAENTFVIMDLKPLYALPITARIIEVASLPEDSKLKAIEQLDAVLEIGISELGLNLYESDSEGKAISQDNQKCDTLENCQALVKMNAHILIYAGIKLIPTAESPSGQKGLVDKNKQPLTLMIQFDNIASKVDVSVVPGTNTLANKDDQTTSQKLESLIQAALKDKVYNEQTKEFEEGFSPVELSFSPILFDRNLSKVEEDSTFSDLLNITGISYLELKDILVESTPNAGMVQFYTSPEINKY